MNTNPDETKLALWLDDELQGEELVAFEAWVKDQPEHLTARAELRRWRERIAAMIPAAEEPPYPDFFNRRVARAIRVAAPEPKLKERPRFSWQALLMPLAACAGMALAFWAGMKSTPAPPDIVVAGAPKAIPVEPIVYTPEHGVKADWFASSKASATVIVLNGLAAIPDETDFSRTSAIESGRESDSTAEIELEKSNGIGL